ncbi:MAG: aspartate dehydrogenase [Longimicrobiales bacterium]|nr:aspartate dehydrogenase [Longimicrobiales bacterium]
MTNVGLIGCGTIGTSMANAIVEGKGGDANLVALFDENGAQAVKLADSLPRPVSCFTDFDRFCATDGMHLVMECASPGAVRALAARVLAANLDLLVVSSGGLADMAFFKSLCDLAARKDRRLMVPSGALGGIDAIRAARELLEEVTLTSTKPPRALSGAPGFRAWEGKELTGPTVVFEGNALEAIEMFPANVNVGVTLSLAGLGPERTKVTIVADPDSPGNVHEVYARGAFGVLRFRLENMPHVTNARTSYLAVLSAIETLRAACTPGPRIGT